MVQEVKTVKMEGAAVMRGKREIVMVAVAQELAEHCDYLSLGYSICRRPLVQEVKMEKTKGAVIQRDQELAERCDNLSLGESICRRPLVQVKTKGAVMIRRGQGEMSVADLSP